MSDLAGLAAKLRGAARVTVLTGAGVSAASGVPTFRGAGGLWRRHRAESLATPDAFIRTPALVWEWYDWRRQAIARVEPNAAHRALAQWGRMNPGVTIVTRNVDGLHERAGTTDLVRLHGSIWRLQCWEGCAAGSAGWTDDRVPLPTLPPRCPCCGGLARPGVIWFGEALPAHALARAHAACTCDVFLAVGTSAVVFPAAGLLHEARSRGAFTVEVNPESTGATPEVDLAVRAPAEEILPLLWR